MTIFVPSYEIHRAMFCGTRSFSQLEERSPKLRKSSSEHSKPKKHTNNKNPYSSTGLDKFEKVLAELQAKKANILSTRKAQGGDATVGFTYESEIEDWIPIVIKQRDEETKTRLKPLVSGKRFSAPPSFKIDRVKESEEKEGAKRRKRPKDISNWCYYTRGNWCWALVIVLVLVALVLGKSFAICWTTMWWYMVPMIKKRSEDFRRIELRKGMSDKKLGGGVNGLASPKGHANYAKKLL